jgi:DNA-binding transcriptional ArsR family regulator
VANDVFRALAAPTRRKILDELAERSGQTTREICTRLSRTHHLVISRQGVSQHLAVLEAAGLVESRREGRYKLHCLTAYWASRLDALEQHRKGEPMTEPTAYGTLETIDGRPMLRFERKLAHPVERVWRAISEPGELERWFPAAVDWTPEVGETFEAGGAALEVTEVDPPHRLAWVYAGQPHRFELTAHEDGCRLIFTHMIDDPALAAQTATGWHTYLSRLTPHLAGEHLSEGLAHEEWAEIHERYATCFGIDPTPGRRFAAALRTGL